MKLTANRVDGFVDKPDPKVWAVLVYGTDRGLVRERAARLIEGFGVDASDPFAVATISEDALKADPARLEDEARAMALTGAARAVRVLLSGDAAATPVSTYLHALDNKAFAPAARVIVEAGALATKSKLRKAFEAAKSATTLPCYADGVAALGQLVDGYAREGGFALSEDARALLIPRLEGDRALARSELEKLSLYAHGRDAPLEVADIEALIAGAEPGDVNGVADAALNGDPALADAAYNRALAAGATTVGVLLALQRAVMRLDALRTAMESGASVDDAINRTRPPLFGPKRFEAKAQLHAWSRSKLDDALDKLIAAERALKTAGAADESVCGRLVLSLAMAGRRR